MPRRFFFMVRTVIKSSGFALAAAWMAIGPSVAFAQMPPTAAVRATAYARVEQPAMIAASRDLLFAVTATGPFRITKSAPGSGPAGTPGSDVLAQSTSAALRSMIPSTARATFVIAGDGRQSISVTVPPTVDLTRKGGAETAVLTTVDSLADGAQFLGGDYRTTGMLSFKVGGQVTLASSDVVTGVYNGVLAVIAQFN